MKGEKIVAEELSGGRNHEFSLAGYPQGLYFILVVSGKSTRTAKMVVNKVQMIIKIIFAYLHV
jgi:hypothetical protein